jgi:hypothetical protein
MRLRVLAAVTATLIVGCSGTAPGALAHSVWPTGVTITYNTDVGVPVAIGGPMMLVNDSDGDVTVENVSLVHTDGEMNLVGWVVRDVRNGESTGVQVPFPPSDARPASSRTLAPSLLRNDAANLVGDSELVLGVSMDAPGSATVTGVRVDYTDASGRHNIVFPLTLVLCAPKAEGPGCSLGSTP